MAREILWTVSAADNTISPAGVQDGGVQGENNATEVVFRFGDDALLNEEGIALYIECVDAYGGYDRTPQALTPEAGQVRCPVPLAWTQHGGKVTVRLVAERDGQTVYTQEGRLAFAGRPAGKKVDSLLKADIQGALQQAQNAADNAAAEAAQAEQSRRGAAAHMTVAQDAAAEAQTSRDAAEAASSQAMSYLNYAANARDAAKEAADEADASATAAAASAEDAAAVREEIVQRLASGEFKGEPGAPGEKGDPGEDGAPGADGANGLSIIPAMTANVSTTKFGTTRISISDLAFGDRMPSVNDTVLGANGYLGSISVATSSYVTVMSLGVCLKGADGAAGADGEDGYTPVKGTDYFTEADKAAMVEDVLASLPVYDGSVTSV